MSKNCLFYIFSLRNDLLKVTNFYENVVPFMIPRIFRRYFRMYQETLQHLTAFLQPQLQQNMYARISVDKKVAMTCCYLGTNLPIIQ